MSTSKVKTDLPFALIPAWLLDLEEISHAAIRLYCVLARYADAEGSSYPGRKLLAKRLKVKSVDTVDRALKELIDVGAVTVTARFDDSGDRTSSLYTVHRYPPEGVAARMRPPTPDDAGTSQHGSGDGGRTDAAQNENHLNENPLTPTPTPTPSSPPCLIHPNGDGKNCRACRKAKAAQIARDAAAAARAAEQKRIEEERAEHERIRAAGRSPVVEQVIAEVREKLAGVR